jgi:hypothetical protein
MTSFDTAEKIGKSLGGSYRNGAWQSKCPAHDDKSPSLQIWDTDQGTTSWHCYAGCPHSEVKAALEKLGFNLNSQPDPKNVIASIIHRSMPTTETPVILYLQSRGIKTVPPENVIRWVPDVYTDKATGINYGAMLSILRNATTGLVTAIGLVYLTPEGKKAPIDVKKRTMGVINGSGVLLPGKMPTVLCEGVEDALVIWEHTGQQVIACLGLNYTKMPLGTGQEVIIARDNDPIGSKPDKKTEKEIRQLKARGLIVRVALPDQIEGQEKSDFNDILKAAGPERVKQLIEESTIYKDPSSLPTNQNGLDEHSALSYMNDRFLVTREQGKTVVIEEAWDGDMNRHVLFRLSFTDLKNFFLNRKVIASKNNRTSILNMADYWLEHAQRRQYDAIVFKPAGSEKHEFNLWRGWNVEPQSGDWSRLKHHMFENICRGRQDLYDYLFNWMARGVQEIDVPNEVALVFRGRRGTGKGTLAHIYGRLFGQHYLQISQAKHLLGHFNAHLRDTLFLFADEAFWAGDKQGESVLKTLITEPTLTIESKGRDVVTSKNRLKLMISSNNDWVVPAGLEERRFAVFDVGDKQMQNTKYFAELKEQMETGGLEALLHDLLNADLSKWDVRKVPKTEGLLEQKMQSMEPVTKWWFEKLLDGVFTDTDDEWPEYLYKDATYDQLKNWFQDQGINRKLSKSDLRLKLKKFFHDEMNETRDRAGRKWKLRPLKECRQHFEQMIGQEVDWEQGTIEESSNNSNPHDPLPY